MNYSLIKAIIIILNRIFKSKHILKWNWAHAEMIRDRHAIKQVQFVYVSSRYYRFHLINKFKWSVCSLIIMQRAGKGKALPSAFLTLNDATGRQQVRKEGHVVNGSFNVLVWSAPLRYWRKWIAIPPAVAQPCVLRFLVCTTSRRHEHAGNVSKKKNVAWKHPRVRDFSILYLQKTSNRSVPIIYFDKLMKFIYTAKINKAYINKTTYLSSNCVTSWNMLSSICMYCKIIS